MGESETTVKSTCKHCGKPVHSIPWDDQMDWIHDDDLFTCWDGKNHADSDDPKPSSHPVTTYYSHKFIKNLKANIPLTKMHPGQIIPVDDFADYQPVSSPVQETVRPEPPKKEMPKALDMKNGRKFRDE